MKGAPRILGACVLLAPWLATTAPAGVVTLPCTRDNTLFEDASGSLSNGAGPVSFAGNSGTGLARRAVLAFDIASAVPAGSHIEEATLTLDVSNAPNTTPREFSLHRVLESWGEGTSSTTSGAGVQATTGDATWIHRQWPDVLWAAAGGNFVGSPSAKQSLAGVGFYSWTDPGMVADAQSWLDDPSTNHGWLVLGDEVTLNTARRFESRESATTANRPALVIRYSSSVGVEGQDAPLRVTLGPSVPNPAVGWARVGFDLPRPCHARLEVVDVTGHRVATLLDAWVADGRHAVVWNGRDAEGRPMGAGVYFHRLSLDGRLAGVSRVVFLP